MKTKANVLSPRRAAILHVLRTAGSALHLREIVERTDLDYNNARSAVSEMTIMGLLVRVGRGIYDLPERRGEPQSSASSSKTLLKILQNQQILNALLNIVITNKALMEALLLGQQEIIQTLRSLHPTSDEGQVAIENMERAFKQRVEWHFNVAAQRVVEQYTKLPTEVFDVLTSPLAHNATAAPEQPSRIARSRRRNATQPAS